MMSETETTQRIPLLLREASEEDRQYAHDLTYKNMNHYYVETGLEWSTDIYNSQWTDTVNMVLHDPGKPDSEPLGVLRLQIQQPYIYLWDIQLEPRTHGQGLGAEVLLRTLWIAGQINCRSYLLKVFKQNPAIRLYKRFGFKQIAEDEYLYTMERMIEEGEEFAAPISA
ncbi:GNAT family N-acetyltransferase [Pokkaliibacter sp. CJK22405]|uniref:GNAT family N-acetyltransferase n=1 Tax=Pokkaliibacter sp. CJK22405 TaxID=3384615 RepID=UPI003984DE09